MKMKKRLSLTTGWNSDYERRRMERWCCPVERTMESGLKLEGFRTFMFQRTGLGIASWNKLHIRLCTTAFCLMVSQWTKETTFFSVLVTVLECCNLNTSLTINADQKIRSTLCLIGVCKFVIYVCSGPDRFRTGHAYNITILAPRPPHILCLKQAASLCCCHSEKTDFFDVEIDMVD